MTAVHLRFDQMQAEGGSPWPALVVVAPSPPPVEVLRYSLTALSCCETADREGRFFKACERSGKGLHMRHFASHGELEFVDGIGVVGVINKTFVDDFGACFGSDVAAQINIQFAGDFQVVPDPRIAHGVGQRNVASAGDTYQRIRFCIFAFHFRRLEVHADEGAQDFKMTEFFGPDVEEKIALGEVVNAVRSLDRVLHGSGQLAIGTAELFEEHITEGHVGSSDIDHVQEFLDMVIHPFLQGSR